MLKSEVVARGRTCACGSPIEKSEACIVEVTGSGKWTRKQSLCKNCGTQALIKERDKLNKLEVRVYGEDGA